MTVSTEPAGPGEVVLRFSVRDTGAGIPPEKRDLIFQAFAQADSTTTRKYGGTGLGLTISARLVEMMGGRIWVESEVGRGSCFHFTGRFRSADSFPSRLPTPQNVLEGIPVLVVDDSTTNRVILEKMLRNWRMRPVAAESARGALALLEDAARAGEPFALALVDANMPGMDGFELVECIRKRAEFSGIAILVLTSAGQAGDAARWRGLGIAGCLTKPVRQAELRAAVSAALGRISTHRRERVESHAANGGRSLHVLVVEDNHVNQRVVARFLEKRGDTVTLAGNGREALTALDRERFDVVLMDVQMPEMDGFEAAAAIRARENGGPRQPIIAMTAFAMKGDEEKCLAAGMDAYISKPVSSERLFAAIDTLLAGRPV